MTHQATVHMFRPNVPNWESAWFELEMGAYWMSDIPDPEQLKSLDARIKAAQAGPERMPKFEGKYAKLSTAWRMVVELVVGMVMGMGIGFGLDRLFGTLPIFLILFSLLGFAAGIRVMMGTAEELQRQKTETPDRAED